MKLSRRFFQRPTLDVARELVGMVLTDAGNISDGHRRERSVRIVEVEAYIGEDDPACHAAPGPTRRNQIMYGPPGVAYIYLIYGMYYCLNVVTERESYPAAILIRAAEPLTGELELNPKTGQPRNPDGPGKLCLALNLDISCNGLDLTGERLYLVDRNLAPRTVAKSQRIGISVGQDKFWRFYDPDSHFVSNQKSFKPKKAPG